MKLVIYQMGTYIFNSTILRYFRNLGCTRMWKYASFRSMDVTQLPGDNDFRIDLVVSILNFFFIKRFRGFRFITGLRPPTFLAERSGCCKSLEMVVGPSPLHRGITPPPFWHSWR